MNLCTYSTCTGCGACIQICPVQAISFLYNKIGLRQPAIDRLKCIDCKNCEATCPVINPPCMSSNNKKVYMAYNKSPDIVLSSASGGLFFSIAKYIIEQGGVVFGASYNKNFDVDIGMTNTIEGLQSFHGSKYVESFVNDAYQVAKENLDNGKLVYFTGLPCQIAGLVNYLRKPYSNLVTSDIVCHGTCSSKYFQMYLQNVRNRLDGNLVSFNQTSKTLGWSILIQRNITITTTKTTTTRSCDKDSYLRLFLDGLFFKPTCYSCKFAKLARVSDITLGDFFGFGVLYKKPAGAFTDNGISMVMINSINGQGIFSKIMKDVVSFERPLKEAVYYNHNLWKPTIRNSRYASFYSDSLNAKTWTELEKKYFYDFKYAITRKIRILIKKILGAKIVAYCMFGNYKLTGLIRLADTKVEEQSGK